VKQAGGTHPHVLKGFVMNTKGFFGSLFDLSFTEFVTTRVIKVLYILAMVGAGIASFGILITFFSRGFFFGILGLIVSPIVFLLNVLMARIWLEVIIVLFRIAENTGRLVEQDQTRTASSPTNE
jgi:hypothetical protein